MTEPSPRRVSGTRTRPERTHHTSSHPGREAPTCCLYARTSTVGKDQDPETQLGELRAIAKRAGWRIVAEYIDHGVSGSRERQRRPAFDQMLKAATQRQFSMVAAWSVDRLGRSLQDLLAFLGELHALDVGLYLHRQKVDTSTPHGRAMFQMIGVFAEFEREMVRERVKAGMAKARADGKHLGRPPADCSSDTAALRADRQAGLSLRQIAAKHGCSPATVGRYLNAAD